MTIVSPRPRAASSSAASTCCTSIRGRKRHARALGALGELAARGVLLAPPGFGQHERGAGELLDRHRARSPAGIGAGVDDLELRDRRAHLQPVVVDRQRDEPGFEPAGPHGVGELARVLADDADRDLGVAARERLDESGEEQVMGGAERAQRRRAARQRARPSHDVGGLARCRERALGLRAQQPARVGEREAPAGADEQRDAELGLEVRDLFGDARAGEVQDVGGGGERPVLGGGEEVGELLERQECA